MQAEMERSDFHIFPEVETNANLEFLSELGFHAYQHISTDFNQNPKTINVILLPDSDHTDLNIKHLNHHYSTDVLTFDLSDEVGILEGEIYLNVDMIKTNATEFGESFFDELLRIIIHGLLHLVGLNDHTSDEKKEMSEKEDFYINQAKVSCETL